MSAGRMERVKTALRTHAELCAMSDLYGDALANGRNDISELSRRGWVIDSHWTTHERISHKHYQLVSEPTPGDIMYQRRMRLVATFPNRKRA